MSAHVRHYWQGLSIGECARELGVPDGTAKSRLAKAPTKASRYTQPARVGGLFWRPAFVAHYEILWSTGQRIEALSHPPGTVAPLFTTAAGAVAIRPDGSGLLLAEVTGPAAGVPSTKLIVLDLATRQTAEMMVISGPFGASHAVIPRGVILR